MRSSRLGSVGGAAALQATKVPSRPDPTRSSSVFQYISYKEESEMYRRQTEEARKHLQHAFQTVATVARTSLRNSKSPDDISTTCDGSDAKEDSLQKEDGLSSGDEA